MDIIVGNCSLNNLMKRENKMTEEFKKIIKLVLAHEGGYVNHPRDKGKETNMGITIATYLAYQKLHPNRQFPALKDITVEIATEIYWHEFAKKISFEYLPSGLNYAVLDFAVNSGVSRASKYLQSLLDKKVKVDGLIGAKTLNAISQYPVAQLINQLNNKRLSFVRGLDNYDEFGKGWENRIASVRKNALAMVNNQQNIIADYPPVTTPKAEGKLTFKGAISESRRAKGGAIALIGGLIGAIPEAINLVKPATELFAGLSYAPIIGNILTILGALYIVHIKQKETV